MKSYVLIFTVLLSFIIGGGWTNDGRDRNTHRTDAVVRCTDKDTTDKKTDFNDAAILQVRTETFSGNGCSFASSLQSTRSGRRVQPSTKSAYRVIKDGKVLDINNFYTLRAFVIQFRSGIHTNSRYIYSICQLLI